jgi:hypothetical protein
MVGGELFEQFMEFFDDEVAIELFLDGFGVDLELIDVSYFELDELAGELVFDHVH